MRLSLCGELSRVSAFVAKVVDYSRQVVDYRLLITTVAEINRFVRQDREK